MSTHPPVPSDPVERLHVAQTRAQHGGAHKYHEKNATEGKLFCRERLRLFFDENSEFVEDGLLANNQAHDLAADGVVIGIGRVIGDGGYFFTVSDIAVGPAHQGKGVARMIMTRLTTWLRENAPAKSFVSLFADAGVPPLYEKFGFRICGAEDTGMVWNRDAQ